MEDYIGHLRAVPQQRGLRLEMADQGVRGRPQANEVGGEIKGKCDQFLNKLSRSICIF